MGSLLVRGRTAFPDVKKVALIEERAVREFDLAETEEAEQALECT
jgi:hypothetical protein